MDCELHLHCPISVGSNVVFADQLRLALLVSAETPRKGYSSCRRGWTCMFVWVVRLSQAEKERHLQILPRFLLKLRLIVIVDI